MNNIEENKMNNVEILYQECKVCGKSFRPPTRKDCLVQREDRPASDASAMEV